MMNTKVVQLMNIYNFYFSHLVIWQNLNLSNLKFWKTTSSNQNLRPKMISTKKVMNTKVVQLINIYNFYFSHLIIWQNLNLLNFEILKNDKFEPKFETQIDFNIKSDEYQSCSTHEYLQLLFWSFLHLTNS